MKPTEKCQILTTTIQTLNAAVHIRGSIEEFNDYSELYALLSSLTPDDSLTMYLNTPGGDCSIGFSLAEAIVCCQCPVTMVVEYPTCSMGAILALCGDALMFVPGSYLMFHDYSGGMYGKGEEVLAHGDHFRKIFKQRFNRFCKPFLTQSEINKMFKGEDIYIVDDCPSLPNRISRHFK